MHELVGHPAEQAFAYSHMTISAHDDKVGLPPTGRVARPDDVARLALFFASEQSDHVTGQAWNVDGGAVMS